MRVAGGFGNKRQYCSASRKLPTEEVINIHANENLSFIIGTLINIIKDKEIKSWHKLFTQSKH